MDDYEAQKAAGGEITALDTLVYVKSKSAAGYDLTGSDVSDLRLASGFVIDDATNGIRENLEANIRVNSKDDVNASLSVLDRFDADDAAAARGYLSGVRESERQRSVIVENSNTILANDGLTFDNSTSSSSRSVRDVIEGWGQGLNSWGTEKNQEITNSSVVKNAHEYGVYLNNNPDVALATCFGAGVIGTGVPIFITASGTALATDRAKDAIFGAVTNTASYIATTDSNDRTVSGYANVIITGGATGLITSPMTGSAAYNTVTRFFGGAIVGGSADAASQFVKNDMTFNDFNGWQTATNAILTGTGTAFGGILHSSGTSYMTRSGLSNATMLIPAASTNYVVDQITKE